MLLLAAHAALACLHAGLSKCVRAYIAVNVFRACTLRTHSPQERVKDRAHASVTRKRTTYSRTNGGERGKKCTKLALRAI